MSITDQTPYPRSSAHLLGHLFSQPHYGRTALVSSFGSDAVVLLHMLSQVKPDGEVLFLDTGKHFEQTLAFRDELIASLGLTGVRSIRPDPQALATQDPKGTLHKTAPESCCALRKVAPLKAALEGVDTWINGRKAYQGQTRQNLQLFEQDGPRLKVNILFDWSAGQIASYKREHNLPEHPLLDEGYLSIGCEPCTQAVMPGADQRSGRWAGQRNECGIHFINGKVVRSAAAQ